MSSDIEDDVEPVTAKFVSIHTPSTIHTRHMLLKMTWKL